MNVTILMCTFQGAEFLGPQLNSFAAQNGVSHTLWVSDDGSTDATLDIVQNYTPPNGTRTHIVNGPGRGFAANFLSLLCHADLPTGWMALSDQDDVWFPNKLRRAVRALSKLDPDRPAMACGRTMLTDARLKPIGLSKRHRHFSFRNALVQNVVAGNTIVLNPAAHALVRDAGVVDVPYHDWWCYQLISGAGGQIVYDQRPCMYYRQHGRNVLGENQSVGAVARRAGSFGSRKWRRWFETNLAALYDTRDLLAPDQRAMVEDWAALPRRSALQRARAMGALRPYRQKPHETAALYGGVVLGLA